MENFDKKERIEEERDDEALVETTLATLADSYARRGFDAMKLRAIEAVAKTKLRVVGDTGSERAAAEFAVRIFRGEVLSLIGETEFPRCVVARVDLETAENEEDDAPEGTETGDEGDAPEEADDEI